jgi:tetratricopeptide (TPR) repeat protein
VAAADEAPARGEAVTEAHARAARFFAQVQIDSEAAGADMLERFDGLREVFENAQDDLGLARLWRARALVYWLAGRCTAAEASWMRAVRHGRRARDDHSTSDALVWLASSAREGPFPVAQALARCRSILEQLRADRRSQALALRPMASLEAMRARFDSARGYLDDSDALLADLGVSMHSAISEDAAIVALAAGDAESAEGMLRASYAHLEQMGERALLSTNAAVLARALYAQGRDDEALTFLDAGQAAAADDDLAAQITCRAVRAQVLARRGEIDAARRLVSVAVDLARRTDWLTDQAEALMACADVMHAADDPSAAATAAREALELYERKGHVVGARRARDVLAREIAV